MRALFIDSDPTVRGLVHCMSAMADLDHAIVSSAEEALLLLSGHPVDDSELWGISQEHDDIRLVVTEIDLPGISGYSFAEHMHITHPDVFLFAHTHPESIEGGELFDRVFFKPDSTDQVIRSVLGMFGRESDRDIFHSMIPGLPAA